MQMLDRLGGAAGADRIFRREMQEAKNTLRLMGWRRSRSADPAEGAVDAELAKLLETVETSKRTPRRRRP